VNTHKVTAFLFAAALTAAAHADPKIMADYEFYSGFETANSAWTAHRVGDALAGTRDNTVNHSPHCAWSIRSEQLPAPRMARHVIDPGPAGSPIGETDPAFIAVGNVGTVELYFYDDNSPRKSFLLAVEGLKSNETDATTVGLGLLDLDPGSSPNYYAQFDTTTIDSGIARTPGWHKLELTVTALTGSSIRLDNQSFPGNTSPDPVLGRFLVVRTDVGDPLDANQVWIDDVRYKTIGVPSPVTINPGWTGHLNLGATGARIKIETNADPDGGTLSFEHVYTNPGGTIPNGTIGQTEFGPVPINTHATDRLWRITNTGLTDFTYRIQLAVQDVRGLVESGPLCILKRDDSSSPWTPVASSIVHGGTSSGDGDLIFSTQTLSSFSEFTLGSNNSVNPLPVAVSSFAVE